MYIGTLDAEYNHYKATFNKDGSRLMNGSSISLSKIGIYYVNASTVTVVSFLNALLKKCIQSFPFSTAVILITSKQYTLYIYHIILLYILMTGSGSGYTLCVFLSYKL